MQIDRSQRADIDIYHGDPQNNLLRTIRDTMSHEGFRGMTNFGSLQNLRDALNEENPDVLVLGAEFESETVCSTINELRHNVRGKNPFVPVIITTWEPDQDLVEKIAGCGADALLVKPFAPKQLINRIEYLAHKRKPFVVTSEYIGPDRKKDTSRQSKIPLIDVPNTLRDKVHGVARDPAALQLEINAALTRVNEEKLSRHAFQIGFLVGLIRPSFEDDELDELCSEHIDRLVFVAQDVKRRMLGTKYEHVGELCQSLIRLVGGIQENFPKSNEKEMELLKQLSDAVLAGFHPDNDAAAMAEEITSSINVLRPRKGAKLRNAT